MTPHICKWRCLVAHDPEVIPVRREEQLDCARLEPYLRANLDGADGPFSLAQFAGGHANLTYLLTFGTREFVLRRPPLGPIAARSHDMQREYRVLSRLYAAFDLAPRAFALCTDASIIGSDFVVEERKHGIAIRRELPPSVAKDPTMTRRLGEMMIDTLAALHRVRYADLTLSDLGKPDGYVLRQLTSWSQRWKDSATDESADASDVIARLERSLPSSQTSTIIHNDFKLDNMLVRADDPAAASALLDWDMCTLGDPLMDLGYLLALWVQADDPPNARVGAMPTWHPGFLTRREATQRYAQATGFDVSAISWYYVFNIFRFAGILQQIYKRYANGQTHDERFASFGKQANALIRTATLLAATPSRG